MPPTTDAHTYRPADTVRPSRSMACVSTEKVEKVVNAPRNPAPSDTVTTSDHPRRSPARSKKPRAKDPTRLMPSVVHGKSLDVNAEPRPRSEERRVGQGCVSTCSSRWSPYH